MKLKIFKIRLSDDHPGNDQIRLIIVVLLALTVLSCSKETDPLLRTDLYGGIGYIPSLHQTKEFDLNNDLISDFSIRYNSLTLDGTGPNSSGSLIEGVFIPLNTFRILKKQENGYFLCPMNDTIYANMNMPYSWESGSIKLVEIRTFMNTWPGEWTITSGDTKDFYYLAFKIQAPEIVTGWMKIKIDKATGLIEIKETKISDQNF